MKTCIITGANSGIGKSAAFQIARQGHRVILACRNVAQANTVAEEIRACSGNQEVFARRVDLSLVEDAKRFTQEYLEEFGALDVLINNAADFDLSRKKPLISIEGHETQFATNLLSPFVLVQKLLPALRQSEDGRIINIGTQGLISYPNISFDFEIIRGDKSYSPARTYYQTKLGLLMLSLVLREQIAGTGVTVQAIRVTNVKVDLARYPGISPVLKAMYRIKSRFSISPDEMANVYTVLAVGEKRDGFYYDEKLREVQCNKNAYDQASQQKLWRLCEKLSQ